jgi:ketosteroid isomerase-like protein
MHQRIVERKEDTMKELAGREIVERYMRAIPRDFDTLCELQHPDFVQEYPQSGEVIRGRDNFRKANERYAQVQTETRRVTGTEDRWILAPGWLSLTPTRIVGAGDTFTIETLGTYPGGDTYHVVAILELRDGKVFRGRTYFAAPFEAPAWRAPYVEPMPRPDDGKSHEIGRSEVDAFLDTTIPRQVEAEEALHRGDPTPRMAMWSHEDPVTLFGALGPCKSGWGEVSRIFRWVASLFSSVTEYRFDLVAAGASRDLAYTVGYERSTVSVDGGPPEPKTLRVTHVYRRENGEWKIVHRHGDFPPVDQSPPAQASTESSRQVTRG